MKRKTLLLSALVSALSLSAGYALAGDPQAAKEKPQDQKQVYGSQLMTQEEQMAYRSKMRATKTTEERDQLRKEHHEQMQERAKARGVTLPDEPPARGGGMGPGGGGMGPGGGGMGPGGGRGLIWALPTACQVLPAGIRAFGVGIASIKIRMYGCNLYPSNRHQLNAWPNQGATM
jgi:hypothetical protein